MFENLKMSNKAYDTLKIIAQLVLPLAAFLTSLGDIWGLPHMTEVVATLVALDTLLGAFLKIVSDNYQKQTAADNYIIAEEPIDESEAEG